MSAGGRVHEPLGSWLLRAGINDQLQPGEGPRLSVTCWFQWASGHEAVLYACYL